MILLKCHIINFGCLSDLDIEFQKNLHELILPNGSGKSTFAAFLCAMFYGLDSNNKKDLSSNSRKHYTPWNQGTFGGSVDFTYQGISYHLERTFGSREKEDTFSLYNLNTMDLSSDFSANPGPQIFGIDKEGFMKTLYLPQLKLTIEPNSSLSSRLISLTYSTDDINRYDQAIKALDKATRSYVKTGNRGSIAEESARLSELEKELSESLAAGQHYQELEEEILQKKAQSKLTRESLKELDEKILNTTQRQTLALCTTHQHNIKEYESQFEQSSRFFKGQLPDPVEISGKIALCRSLALEESLYRDKRLTDSEYKDYYFLNTLFSELPEKFAFSESELQLLSRNITYQNEAALYLADLEERTNLEKTNQDSYEELVPLKVLNTLEDKYLLLKKKKDSLNAHAQRISLLKEQQLLIEDKRKGEEKPEAKKDWHSDFTIDDLNHYLIAAVAVIFLSLLLVLGHHPFIAFFLFFLFVSASAAYIYLQILLNQQSYDYQLRLYEENQQKLLSEEEEVKAKLDMLGYESDLLKDSIRNLTKDITDMASHWNISNNGVSNGDPNDISNDVSSKVSILSDDFLSRLSYLRHVSIDAEKKRKQRRNIENSHRQFYLTLKTKWEHYQSRQEIAAVSKNRISHCQEELKNYLCLYYPEIMRLSDSEEFQSAVYREKLQDLKLRIGQYQQILEQLKKVRLQYQDFLHEHPELPRLSSGELDFSELQKENALSDNLLTLRSRQAELSTRYEEEQKELGTLDNQKSILASRMEEYSLLEEKKHLLSSKIDKAREHVKLLKLTTSYLEQAKAYYAKAYLKSIERHIKDFSGILSCELLKEITFTQDFSLQISDQGLLRSSDWYSQGTQDLFAFCCRLAFIEDLYPKEKPFLILDDSFVNLDEASLDKVRILLKDLSDKYQIIYFTCHSSRSLLNSQADQDKDFHN